MGKLDLLNREGSSIVYTLSSMKNISGTVTAAELIGADAHRFDYELDTSGAKPTVTLTLKDGETYSTATTYKVAMRFTVSGLVSTRKRAERCLLTTPAPLNQ